MFVILWEYEVKTGCEESFERAYGPQGSWVELFRHSPHYLSTQLSRDPLRSSIYFTLDFWESQTAYAQFKRAYHAAYNSLDLAASDFFSAERYLGSFARVPDDHSSSAT
jgi:heme-degrading monooxygenase HmoA